MLRLRSKCKLKQVDLLLPIISIYCFYMLYAFVNTELMVNRMPALLADEFSLPFLKVSWVFIFYSLCIGYIVLRMVGNLPTTEEEDRSSYLCVKLQQILLFVSTVYIFFLGYFSTFQMFLNIRKNVDANTSPINVSFVIVKFILESLPGIFTILIMLAGIMLLKTMISSHMKEEEIKAANQLGIIGKRCVYVTLIANITLNVLQFLLPCQLNDMSYLLEISVVPLILAFSAMILAGYFRKTKELYEDNEMII